MYNSMSRSQSSQCTAEASAQPGWPIATKMQKNLSAANMI